MPLLTAIFYIEYSLLLSEKCPSFCWNSLSQKWLIRKLEHTSCPDLIELPKAQLNKVERIIFAYPVAGLNPPQNILLLQQRYHRSGFDAAHVDVRIYSPVLWSSRKKRCKMITYLTLRCAVDHQLCLYVAWEKKTRSMKHVCKRETCRPNWIRQTLQQGSKCLTNIYMSARIRMIMRRSSSHKCFLVLMEYLFRKCCNRDSYRDRFCVARWQAKDAGIRSLFSVQLQNIVRGLLIWVVNSTCFLYKWAHRVDMSTKITHENKP